MGRIYKEFYCRAKRKGCNQWVEGKFAPYPATDGKFYLSAVPVGPVYEIDLDTVEYLYEIPESPPAMAEKEVRLIDANALESALEATPIAVAAIKGKMFRLIEDAPTIDPESLRPHGKWVRDGDFLVCLNCESEINVKNSLGVENKKNYCPNCGAKMDLEE